MQLYDYQKPVVDTVVPMLQQQRFALINADMGTGKTIMACEIAKRLLAAGTIPAVGVIAPKITLSSWERTAADVGVTLAFCCNPEMLRTGRKAKIVVRNGTQYVFQLPKDSLIIIDEIHRHGAMNSQLAQLAFGAKLSSCKVLGCTGTLGQSPLRFRVIMSLSDLVPWNGFYAWVAQHGCWRDHDIQGSPWRFVKGRTAEKHMSDIGGMLFPQFGQRLSIDSIPGFPECDMQAQLYDVDADMQAKINDVYNGLRQEIKNPDAAKTEPVQFLRRRQQVQALKVPLFVEVATELLEEGKSVVVFFDFREPLFQFADQMNDKGWDVSLVHGDQSREERDGDVDTFQANKVRVLACITEAGGIGLNAGDEHGGHPRVALLNLPLDGIGALQAAKRVHRATNKTKAVAQFVLLAGSPVEERVYRLLRGKLKNLASVQGDDVTGVMLQ